MKYLSGFRLVVAIVVVPLLVGLSSRQSRAQSEYLRGDRMPYDAFDRLAKTDIDVPQGIIHVAFAPGEMVLPKAKILDWVRTSAKAVSTFLMSSGLAVLLNLNDTTCWIFSAATADVVTPAKAAAHIITVRIFIMGLIWIR